MDNYENEELGVIESDEETEETKSLYNEKNDAVIAPDSYYTDVALREQGGEERYYELFDKDKPKSYVWSVIALVLGICAAIVSVFHWIGLALAIGAVVFAAISRVKLGYFDTFTIIAIISAIFGIVFCVANIFYGILISGGAGVGTGTGGGAVSDI
jgi:hypothetical protein